MSIKVNNIKNSLCRKCHSDAKVRGSYFTEAGEVLYFCNICSKILDEMPQGNKVGIFLRTTDYSFIKNMILKNIFLARMERKNKAKKSISKLKFDTKIKEKITQK